MAFAFCARWRRVRSPILFDSLARIRRMQDVMRDIMASLSLPPRVDTIFFRTAIALGPGCDGH
jgi:predicted MarR family transcription regulator